MVQRQGQIDSRPTWYQGEKNDMKLVAISGSRNPEGRTARAAYAFLEGTTAGIDKRELIFLPELNIERCRQCNEDGWGICRTEGRCEIEDDFSSLVDKIKDADATLFATPVYYGDLTESMRAFLDRLRRTCMDQAGREGIDGKSAVGLCLAGGGGGGAPSCAFSLDKVLSRCGFDVVDVVLARRQNLDLKLDVLRASGRWLVDQVQGTVAK